MSQPLLVAFDLVSTECCVCGALIWTTAEYRANRKSDKQVFYCQNGHGEKFLGETDAAKAVRLERVVADLTRQNDNLASERRMLLEKVKKLTPPRPPRTPKKSVEQGETA